MMQRARRAGLLVAFYLVTSVAPAFGKCAWVLWMQTGPLWQGKDAGPWPDSAYDTAGACEQVLNGRERMASKAGQSGLYTYRCLPDTVDPRGPKAK